MADGHLQSLPLTGVNVATTEKQELKLDSRNNRVFYEPLVPASKRQKLLPLVTPKHAIMSAIHEPPSSPTRTLSSSHPSMSGGHTDSHSGILEPSSAPAAPPSALDPSIMLFSVSPLTVATTEDDDSASDSDESESTSPPKKLRKTANFPPRTNRVLEWPHVPPPPPPYLPSLSFPSLEDDGSDSDESDSTPLPYSLKRQLTFPPPVNRLLGWPLLPSPPMSPRFPKRLSSPGLAAQSYHAAGPKSAARATDIAHPFSPIQFRNVANNFHDIMFAKSSQKSEQANRHHATSPEPPAVPTDREVNAQGSAVHALSFQLGAYQRQVSNSRTQARQQRPMVGLEATVDATLSGSSVTKLAFSQWAAELFTALDPCTAFHLGKFMADDPDPSTTVLVQETAQRLLDPVSTETAVTFMDFANETERNLLQAQLDSSVATVADRLEIPTTAASLLLHDFGFHTDQAIQSTLEDRPQTRNRVGLEPQCSKKRKAAPTDDSMRCCGVCYDSLDSGGSMYCLPCHHNFCLDCWDNYIKTTIEGGLTGILTVTCPYPECTERLTMEDAERINPSMRQTWNKAFLHSFVHSSCGSRRLCPAPNCTMVAVIPPATVSTVPHLATCPRCTTSFCMQCGESDHIPATCEDLARFHSTLCPSSLRIKNCQGCFSRVEKSGGCNAMRCTRCSAPFCWRCLSMVDGHVQRVCNPAVTSLGVNNQGFAFFGKRFQVHQSALDKARNQLQSWQSKETRNVLNPLHTSMLCKALETLINTRNFLKNSCIASYSKRTTQVAIG